MIYSNEGKPLPPKPDRTVDYQRDAGRKMVPTQTDFSRDVIGSRQTAEDARVRQHKIDDLNAFTRKKYGRAATAAEIAEYLGEGGAA